LIELLNDLFRTEGEIDSLITLDTSNFLYYRWLAFIVDVSKYLFDEVYFYVIITFERLLSSLMFGRFYVLLLVICGEPDLMFYYNVDLGWEEGPILNEFEAI
jgi:hypothetical protein